MSPTLAGGFFTARATWDAQVKYNFTSIQFKVYIWLLSSFPDSSVDKESACNAGDPGSISGSGRSTGEGIGYPHKYSWASLVAQLVKNRTAVWETWVRSPGWEDPLRKGTATHSSILVRKIPWGSKELDTTERLSRHFTALIIYT